MTLNTSGALVESLSDSIRCGHNMTNWEKRMDNMYTYFYLLLFIPGLLLNTTALWVLCRHISKKTKAVIFMINLSLADLAHILSLPLRIYYYFNHTWPFGQGLCLFCFYLKYLNMYAAIVFLVCISMQRCVFLLNPFRARSWRRRYDLLISLIVWVVVGLACSPFILMRRGSSSSSSPTNSTQTVYNMSYARSIRIARSLYQQQTQDQPNLTAHNSTARSRLQSFISNCPADTSNEKLTQAEKRRALRMVLSCSALFLLCFAPYHLNFLLYLLVSQDIVTHCATMLAVRQFHPVSLCMASLSCCLNPLLYYFLTAEFRLHLTRRTSSFTASLLSSPISSPTQRAVPERLMSMESSCSERE
ncbi:hypothetical protein PBY51_016318 [Eleginops maclovinus]|uniref:G-protein coupled receptors family 1 profile domain-containing protein n=1 Tax=Eleginops maclovinus TaxID=56733 RepID=A0AAN7XN12_ELEMC|nr:hypothetical protein PBY51_016318 [Eleginops maclovinus]